MFCLLTKTGDMARRCYILACEAYKSLKRKIAKKKKKNSESRFIIEFQNMFIYQSRLINSKSIYPFPLSVIRTALMHIFKTG